MIEFKNVSKKYPNGFEALKDIDMTIPFRCAERHKAA